MERARLARRWPQIAADRDARVILQVGADTGAVGDDADPELLQSCAGPMPARCRIAGECSAPAARMISAPRNATLPPACRTRTPVARRPSNTIGLDERLRNNPQVRPAPHFRRQISRGGRHAVPRRARGRDRAEAVLHLAVHVGDIGKAAGRGRFGDGAGKTRPVLAGHAADRDRTVLAVQRSAHVLIVFKLAEIRQHVRPRPAARAGLRPLVVVAGQAAQRHHGVDGGAAAHHTRLLVVPRRRARRRRARVNLKARARNNPAENTRNNTRRECPGLLAGRRIASGFDQEDLLGSFSESRLASTQPAEPRRR